MKSNQSDKYVPRQGDPDYLKFFDNETATMLRMMIQFEEMKRNKMIKVDRNGKVTVTLSPVDHRGTVISDKDLPDNDN